jgi:hypothetical protein
MLLLFSLYVGHLQLPKTKGVEIISGNGKKRKQGMESFWNNEYDV